MIPQLTKPDERLAFDSLIAFNFKPKNKLSIPRLVIETQIALLLLIGATNLITYLWQLATCPAC